MTNVTVAINGKLVSMSEEQARVFLRTYDNNAEAMREADERKPKDKQRSERSIHSTAARWGLRRALKL